VKKNKKNIVICGSHFSPAFSLIEKINEKDKYSVSYIGRKYAMEGDNSLSLEYRTLIKFGIPFFSITTGRLQRAFSKYTLISLFKLPVGFVQSVFILFRVKPVAVMSFGGYSAVPVCFASLLFQIPVMIHEQTSVLGLSNRILSRFAKKICLSYENTKYADGLSNTVFTGNPLRKSFYAGSKDMSMINFGNKSKPLIYITGGSTGSRSINIVIKRVLSSLLVKYRIFHQCGSFENCRDFTDLKNFKEKLDMKIRNDYFVIPNISPNEVFNVMSGSQLVISRSGANTVTEIMTLKKPAIFIPLPWAADNEQLLNAKVAEEKGVAIVINKKDIDPEKLIYTIKYMFNNIDKFRLRYAKININTKLASEKIYEAIEDVVFQDN
jgi:UDP-N-acetylglucosamine--N-acetylmuramyl-(pentapeptide) pyrophosphoryl-undecaprenol N-acetylglucosamine transferase